MLRAGERPNSSFFHDFMTVISSKADESPQGKYSESTPGSKQIVPVQIESNKTGHESGKSGARHVEKFHLTHRELAWLRFHSFMFGFAVGGFVPFSLIMLWSV
jgi:hypothetical protein